MSVHSGGQRFFALLVKRPILLATIFTTALVIGLIAWSRIPIQMMPEGIVEPGLMVFVGNIGASAQENEERVARIVEEELRTLPALKGVESVSREDSVNFFVEFDASTDMNFAKAEVRDRVERARPKLPATVQEIGIFSWSESDLPVMFFALRHPGDSPRTDFLVENVIQRRLEAVDGVGKVDVWGLLQDSMRILLDQDKVRAARLDLGALIRRLSSDNASLSLGEVEDGGSRILLRADTRFRTPEEILDFPIGNGLRIADVGEVVAVKSVRESLFRIDHQQAYFVEIRKDGQANIVATCERLRKEVASLAKDPQLAGEFSLVPIFDQGTFIESSLKQLTDTAWEGGVLAVAILFVFLWRVRQTLLVALSIPISVVLAIAWCYFTGRTFNVLTMTGITLAMGMLVDNAIVVIENIVRLRGLGCDIRESVVRGTSEVGLAVTLSTLTTVVVFMPLIFMTENPILRLMFGELGLPLCVALLISLVVALIFMPVATAPTLAPRPAFLQRIADKLAPWGALPARLIARPIGALSWSASQLRRLAHSALRALVDFLARPIARTACALAIVALCAWRVAHEWPWIQESMRAPEALAPRIAGQPLGVIWLALLGLSTAVALLVLLWRIPAAHKALALPPAAARATTPASRSVVGVITDANAALLRWSLEHRGVACIAAFVCFISVVLPQSQMKVSAFGEDDSKTQLRVYVDLEDNFTLAQASDEMEHYEAFLDTRREKYAFSRMGVRFSRTGGSLRLFWDGAQKRSHLDEVLSDLHEHLPRRPGHHLRFVDDVQNGDSRNKNIVTFRIVGPDSEVLARLGRDAVGVLETVPGLVSVGTPVEDSPQQVQLSIDSDVAQKLGVTPRDALDVVSWSLRGFQLPRYQEHGREVPLIIEYSDAETAGLGTLKDLEIVRGASSVPLSSFMRMEFGRGSRQIWRRNGQATYTLQARIDNPARQKELSAAGYRALGALELPRGYELAQDDSELARQDQEMSSIFAALALSVVLVFLLMGVLFESFLLPISVLFTIPFAYTGAMWSLFLSGTTMDSVGWIGIIILVGVVVNNGIVLIDRIHSLRREDPSLTRAQAVVNGSGDRVRPVLMTALTSVLGLWPMAVSEPPGDGIDYRALATCVGGGLLISTIFTLWVVPLAYTLLDDLATAVAKQTRWSLRPRGGRRAAGAPVVSDGAGTPSTLAFDASDGSRS